MKNIKPFGPSIGKTKISDKFFNKLNKEFDAKSKSKKIDYSSKLASQIKNELKITDKFIKQNLEKELKFNVKKFLFNENIKNIKPFGPSIGKTKISKKFFDKLNKEFDTKSISKKLIIVEN